MRDEFEHYIPVGKDGTAGEASSSLHFMVRALLASRVETGISTDDLPNEEDVNIYLVHLLSGYVNPTYHLRMSKYVSAYDSSIFQRVQHSTSDRLKYTIYKANADHLLMSIGLFCNPRGERTHVLPVLLQIDGETYVGRGKAYYECAFSYSRALFGASSAIPEVLNKLAVGFEKYVRLLTHLRSEYLNFTSRIGDGELYHLQHFMQTCEVADLYNEFLDAYNAWRRQPTPETHSHLQDRVDRLQMRDPTFKFNLTDAEPDADQC